MPGVDRSPRPRRPATAQYVRVDVAGRTESLWQQFRGLFVERIRELVAELGRETKNDYFQDKADELTAPLLRQAMEQFALQSPSGKQVKAFDRVVETFAKRPPHPPVQPQPGQTTEEARFARIEEARAALLGVLACTRVCVGPDDELLIGTNVDALIDLVKAVGATA